MCVLLTYSAIKWVKMMGSNALNSRGKPVVSPMNGSPTFGTGKKHKRGEFTPRPTSKMSKHTTRQCLLFYKRKIPPPPFSVSATKLMNYINKS